MGVVKIHTDINQSRKLAEILPLESADMWWVWYSNPLSNGHYDDFPIFYKPICNPAESVPCWSLTALLGIIPSSSLDSSDDHYFRLRCKERFSEWHDNPIDACYEMILKLYNFKML